MALVFPRPLVRVRVDGGGVVLDVARLRWWDDRLDSSADDVELASARLARSVSGTEWESVAAGRFRQRAAEQEQQLRRAAAELRDAADALRRHAAAVERREEELGAALAEALAAGRAAARSGERAVAAAVETAYQDFQRRARELAEAGEHLVDSAARTTGRAVTGLEHRLGRIW